MEITIPGLLLQSTNYLGKKKVLKIFTGAYGMLSLFAPSCALSPFCLAEWVFQKKSEEKDLYKALDYTLIDPLARLKESYEYLSAAGAIAQDLLKTQLPHKKAQELFDLAYLYLKKIPSSPSLMAASFKLKLLLYEGLLSKEKEPSFAKNEWDSIQTLAFSRSFQEIEKTEKAPIAKIKDFFDAKVS